MCPVEYCNKEIKVRGLCNGHAGLAWRMSIPPEQLPEILGDGSCDICGEFNKPCIDHDHRCCAGGFSCGKCIRGVICHRCNRTLGAVNDNPEILQRLREHVTSDKRVAVGLWTPKYKNANKHKARA